MLSCMPADQHNSMLKWKHGAVHGLTAMTVFGLEMICTVQEKIGTLGHQVPLDLI